MDLVLQGTMNNYTIEIANHYLNLDFVNNIIISCWDIDKHNVENLNNKIKIIGIALANSLTGLSGFLVSQYQGFSDINMGIGIVITGLGSVLIAGSLQKWFNITKIGRQLPLVVAGAIVFQMVLAFALSLGIDPNLLKLVTALFVLFIVAISAIGSKLKKN